MTKNKMVEPNLRISLLNTRPSPMGEELTQLCEKNQVRVLHHPMISTDSILFEHVNELTEALERNNQVWLFVSRTAVNQFSERLKQNRLEFATRSEVIAVGPGTKKQLLHHFPKLNNKVICPEQANSESLVQLPQLNSATTECVWLIKGQGGRDLIKQHLINAQIPLVEIDVYRRIDIQYSEQDILNWLQCQVYLVTSADIGRALISNLKAHLNVDQLKSTFQEKTWLTVSERIRIFLERQGVPDTQIIICEQPDNSSIINNINRLAKRD